MIGYPEDSRPDIKWNHVDGPVLFSRAGQPHWLTLWERLRCWIGKDDAKSLEKKHWPYIVQTEDFTPPSDKD